MKKKEREGARDALTGASTKSVGFIFSQASKRPLLHKASNQQRRLIPSCCEILAGSTVFPNPPLSSPPVVYACAGLTFSLISSRCLLTPSRISRAASIRRRAGGEKSWEDRNR